VNELFGEKNPPCLRYRYRGGAKMLQEQTAQLTFTYSQPRSQFVDGIVSSIESAFVNESQGA
jgi:hypothetical protein